MSVTQILAAQPWVERLGLTLLHFLWQGAMIVTIYAAARKWSTRTLLPNGRYLLACAALAAMAIAPLVTWTLLQHRPAPGVASPSRRPCPTFEPGPFDRSPGIFRVVHFL
jgi:hypothetical protein